MQAGDNVYYWAMNVTAKKLVVSTSIHAHFRKTSCMKLR